MGKSTTTLGGAALSPNFGHLSPVDPLLAHIGAKAERYVFDDPVTALFKLRQFGEVLAQQVAASTGMYTSEAESQLDLLRRLRDRGLLGHEVGDLFHTIRKASGPLAGVRLYFAVAKHGIQAEGASTDEGFVVFAGSVGAREVRDSLLPSWRDLREELIAQGKIEILDKQIRFAKDVLFKSPSAAAAITCGGQRNGREWWKDKTGRTLKELEEALAVADAQGPARETSAISAPVDS